MNRARIYAMHRVVCGHHWKSDIDASLMLVAGVFPIVVTSEAYQAQLKKARAEYQKIKDGDATSAEAPAANEAKAKTPIYDLQGRVLQGEPTSKGVYIQNGVKFAK